MKKLWILGMLMLSGCASMADIENRDDATCRTAIAQRSGPQPPGAYDTCRANIMSLRRDGAIRSIGN